MPLHLAIPAERGCPNELKGKAHVYVRIRSKPLRLSTNPKFIECGRNSGFGALNLAFLMGAKEIYLFGYDYQPDSYYCPERYTHKKPESQAHWPTWAKLYDPIAYQFKAAGVAVFNASPTSTITAFPKITLAEAMQRLHRMGSEGSRSLQCGAL